MPFYITNTTLYYNLLPLYITIKTNTLLRTLSACITPERIFPKFSNSDQSNTELTSWLAY